VSKLLGRATSLPMWKAAADSISGSVSATAPTRLRGMTIGVRCDPLLRRTFADSLQTKAEAAISGDLTQLEVEYSWGRTFTVRFGSICVRSSDNVWKFQL